MTRALLDEARRHDAAMTEGPWEWDDGLLWNREADHCVLNHSGTNWQVSDANATGIAWLRTNLRGLLDAHEQALGEVERLTAMLTELRTALVGVPIIKCADVVTEIDVILKGTP